MCGNLSREAAAASHNGFNICMKMVVEIGLTAINTQQIKHWNQIKEQRYWERGMEWKMVVRVHELYENKQTHSDISIGSYSLIPLVYENMLNTTKWIF